MTTTDPLRLTQLPVDPDQSDPVNFLCPDYPPGDLT